MRRRLLGLLVLLLVALIYGGVWLWQWAGDAPSWYTPAAPGNERAESIAEQFEYRVIEEVHAVRETEEDWRLHLTQAEFNSWLALRLPEWIAHDRELEWPRELGLPQVRLLDDRMQLAIEVNWEQGSHVVVATIRPELQGDRIFAQIEQIGVGRIAFDHESVDRLEELLRGQARTDARWQEGVEVFLGLLGQGASIDGQFEIADGRLVRLTELHVRDGIIDLTGRTAYVQSASRE